MSEHVVLLIESNRDGLQHNRPNERLSVRITLQTSDSFAQSIPKRACRLLLLLDSSVSMDGSFSTQHAQLTRRKGIQSAAKAMLRELQSEDRLSIAFFDSRAYEIADALGEKQRKEIEEAIDQLEEYTGSTNFEEAFLLAKRWASRQPRDTSLRVICLTDGQSSLGNWSKAIQYATELGQEGVAVDCLGVGDDFAFEAMQELSSPSGGTNYHLTSPQEASRCFGILLQNAQRALVQDTLLHLRFSPERRDIEIYEVVPEIRRHLPTPDASGWSHQTLRIGHLYHHQTAQLIVSFAMDTPPSGNFVEMFSCLLDYSIPSLGLFRAEHKEIARLQLSAQAHHERRDTSIDEQAIEASLVGDEMRFRQMHGRDWKEAAKILRQMSEKARRIRLTEKQRLYEQFERELTQHHQLSRDQLNRLFAQGSRSTRSRREPQRKQHKDIDF